MNRKRKYNTLFVLLMTVLFLPILFSIVENHTKQHQFTLPLKGDITIATKPYINVDSWLDGSYQDSLDNYLKDNLGVGKLFIRLHNQLDFSIFRKSNAKDVIIGKDNYLFEKGYIDSYMGTNFIGEEKITNKVKMIRELQDTLSNYGKKLFIVIAPGKGYLYPDKIPDKYYKEKQEKTNYKCFVDKITENNIDFIDFNKWFFTRKDVPREQLIPQTGIHLSFITSVLVFDSICQNIENKFNLDLPDIKIDKVSYTNISRHSDTDIEDGLNLLFKINNGPFIYPNLIYNKKNKDHLKTLVVSDSFYWMLYHNGIINNCFSENNQFWYYCNDVYSPMFTSNPQKSSSLNYKEEILKHEFIILICTEAMLKRFPWGFTKKALNSFKNIKHDENEYQEKIQNTMQNIKNDEEWYALIKQKAINNRIPVDSALYLDAKYMIDTE